MKWSSLLHGVVGAAALCACQPEAKSSGQLIVSIASDMALPQQIDTIQLQIQAHGGEILHDEGYPVGSGNGSSQIPATLTLLAGSDPSQAVTVRVAGTKAGVWRTYREVTTTVPPDRTALLRMPVQWLCDNTVKTVSTPDGMGGTNVRMLSSCDDGNTCMAGRCVPSTIDSKMLPDYAPTAVFGGAAKADQGRCFDTVSCMVKGNAVQPDDHCTIAKPDSTALNVALRVANDGICDSTNTACFVPLDGQSNEGWTVTATHDRLALPQAVCDKLATRLVRAVYVSTACETKTEAIPPCGDWSSVPRTDPIEPNADGTPDVPLPSVIESLLPLDGSASLCCPLMSDSNKLYTCVCQRSPSYTSVVAIDPTVQGSGTPVGGLPNKQLSGLAMSVFAGSLYWLDGNAVQRTLLTGIPSNTTALPVDAMPFSQASVLTDAAGVYLQANVPSVQASPVQLIKLDPKTGMSTHFDTGGNKVVFQFDQDADAMYLARDVDAAVSGGTQRKSAVVRIAKADGHASTLLPDSALMISDVEHGGYVRVRVDGTHVLALFEGAPATDGSVTMEVRRIAFANGAPSGASDTLYSVTLDPAHGQFGLLGALDGAAVMSRIDYDPKNAGTVASSSLLVVPATGGVPRTIADFGADYPGEGLASDANYIYWLNSSGKLYRLSRATLR